MCCLCFRTLSHDPLALDPNCIHIVNAQVRSLARIAFSGHALLTSSILSVSVLMSWHL